MSIHDLVVRLIAAYCPDDMAEREARTDSIIRRAEQAKQRSAAAAKVAKSYEAIDERLCRR